ncbi:MAG: HYR domain-containing protein [Xanthomonadales bacterium]|nr:HYR domain-containing protein [Xanthomonadales bacterium]
MRLRNVWLCALFPVLAPAEGAFAQARENVGDPEPPLASSSAPASPLWVQPLALLLNNGPLVTHTGVCPSNTDASRVQNTSLGLSTIGANVSLSGGFRIADDFTVPAGGWYLNTVTFFSYQTGSTLTSTFNHVNFRIWNGPPNVGTSTVVFGDTSTNRFASTAFSGIYRDTETTTCAVAGGQTRPIMTINGNAGVLLAPGTYWLDWQLGGTLTSGPWQPPVTILGQPGKPGANGLQFNPGTSSWQNFEDSGTGTPRQDAPFVLDGEACTMSVPPNQTVPASATACSATVTFSPTIGPAVCAGGGITTSCTPASGSSFPLGTTTVNCSSNFGHSGSFQVTVVDQTPPTLTCPATQNVVSMGGAPVPVSYTVPATDNCTASLSVLCTPPSGSLFPVGSHTVTCRATDQAGNQGSCSFQVNVTLGLPTARQIPAAGLWALGGLGGLLGLLGWRALRRRAA